MRIASIASPSACAPSAPSDPRIEAERVGDKLVVHNYGHGGSGWSLSWGSGAMALDLITSGTGQSLANQDIAVIGCGALGLTSATLLQKRRGPLRHRLRQGSHRRNARSFRATGSWTPDSRIALTKAASPCICLPVGADDPRLLAYLPVLPRSARHAH